jgi:hypothetical protein
MVGSGCTVVLRTDRPGHGDRRQEGLGRIPHPPQPNFRQVVAEFALGE